MEAKVAGEVSPKGTVRQPIYAEEAVAEVLCNGGKRTPTLLKNIGMTSSCKRATKSERPLQLEAARAGKHDLQCVVADLKQVKDQNDVDRFKIQEELQLMRQKQEEARVGQLCTNQILEYLLAATGKLKDRQLSLPALEESKYGTR